MDPDPTVVLATMQFIFALSILGILAGFGRQWLKVRAQQRALGVSNQELEQKVERLEQANAENAQRLENLETIIVSQTWSALQEPGLSEADRQRRIVAAGRHELHAPAAEDMNRRRAAELAHRLGG
jgi:1,6-anhydro-N-acetylmuramate kinase